MPFDLFYSIVQRNKPPTMDIDVSTFPKHSLMLTSFVPLFQLQWQIASRLLLYSVNNNKVPRNQRQMYASCLPKHISESYVFSPCSEKYARRRSITFVCTLRVYGSFVRICVNGVQVQLTLAHLQLVYIGRNNISLASDHSIISNNSDLHSLYSWLSRTDDASLKYNIVPSEHTF